MPTGVHRWRREQLAKQEAEAKQNLARIQATLRQMGVNALQATPEELAEAKRWADETRALFHLFPVIRTGTWEEFMGEEENRWEKWERTYRLSVLGDYDLDDPC